LLHRVCFWCKKPSLHCLINSFGVLSDESPIIGDRICTSSCRRDLRDVQVAIASVQMHRFGDDEECWSMCDVVGCLEFEDYLLLCGMADPLLCDRLRIDRR